jgi:hypothetical protein
VLANATTLAVFANSPDAVVLTDASSFANFAAIFQYIVFAVTCFFAMLSAATFFFSTLAKVAATAELTVAAHFAMFANAAAATRHTSTSS